MKTLIEKFYQTDFGDYIYCYYFPGVWRWSLNFRKMPWYMKPRYFYEDLKRRQTIRKEARRIYQKVREKHPRSEGGIGPVFFVCDEVKHYYDDCSLNRKGWREKCYDEKTGFVHQNPCLSMCILCVETLHLVMNE